MYLLDIYNILEMIKPTTSSKNLVMKYQQKKFTRTPNQEKDKSQMKIFKVFEKRPIQEKYIISHYKLTLKIGNITFYLRGFSSEKKLQEKRKQMVEFYHENYMRTFQRQKNEELKHLNLQYVRPQDWKYVIQSDQSYFLRIREYLDTTIICYDMYLKIRLQKIVLQKDQIVSIQALTFIEFPHLRKLFINITFIRNINCLSKASMPSLQWIAISNCPIINLDLFYRGNFQNLRKYSVDQKRLNFLKFRIQDLTFLFKAKNFDKISSIWMHDPKRILIKPQKGYLLTNGVKYQRFDGFLLTHEMEQSISNYKVERQKIQAIKSN